MGIDVLLDSDGDLQVSHWLGYTDSRRSLELVAQHVRTRLETHLGDWILDVTQGLNYIGLTQVKPARPDLVAALVVQEILQVADVRGVADVDYSFDTDARRYTVTLRVITDMGDATLSITPGEVPSLGDPSSGWLLILHIDRPPGTLG